MDDSLFSLASMKAQGFTDKEMARVLNGWSHITPAEKKLLELDISSMVMGHLGVAHDHTKRGECQRNGWVPCSTCEGWNG